MNAVCAIFRWAMSHPYLTTGLLLAGGYAVYKLGDKGIDTACSIADHAVEKGYSFESPQVMVKAYPMCSTDSIPEPS